MGNATLTRFFTLHFLIPFLLSAAAFFHIFFLHTTGSNNPLGLVSNADMVPFHIYYTIKDIFGFCVLFTLLLFLIFLSLYFLWRLTILFRLIASLLLPILFLNGIFCLLTLFFVVCPQSWVVSVL